MVSRRLPPLWIIATLLPTVSPSLNAQNKCTPDPNPPCGVSLASFGQFGITAFSNGKDQGQGTSCACSGRFECVEFVKRYYSTELGVDRASQWLGYGKLYWASANADVYGKNKDGSPALEANNKMLAAFSNGGAMPPEINDIVVFDGDTWGHVAIVTSITSNSIGIIEQNWSSSGVASLSYDNQANKVGNRKTYSVLGWLRPSNRKPTGSLDGINNLNQVFGWALDPDTPTAAINVQLFIDKNAGTPGATPIVVTANQMRSDVGAHGFNWAIPATLQDGQNHMVWAWGIDSSDPASNNFQLAGSPRSFNTLPQSQPPVAGFIMSSGTQSATDGHSLNLTVPVGGNSSVTFNSNMRSQAFNGATISGWQWTIDGTTASTVGSFTTSLAKGTHLVTLAVTDSFGSHSGVVSGNVIVAEVGSYMFTKLVDGNSSNNLYCASTQSINQSGKVLYMTNAGNVQAIIMTDGISPVVAADDSLTSQFDSIDPNAASFNSASTVAFIAHQRVSGTLGVFTQTNGVTSIAFDVKNLPAPYSFINLEPTINDRGSIAFMAGGPPGLLGVFLIRSGVLSLAGTGISSGLSLNGIDQLAYQQTLYSLVVNTNSQIRLVADASSPSPYSAVGGFALNDNGQVVFYAQGKNSNDSGLWLNNDNSYTFLIPFGLRNSSPSFNNGGVVFGGVISQSPILANTSSAGVTTAVITSSDTTFAKQVSYFVACGINDSLQVAFLAGFADGTVAIYRGDPR